MYKSNEFIMPHILTAIQHEVIIGSLLGDGNISLPGKYPRLHIKRQILDYSYLKWQFNIFQNLCSSSIKTFEKYDKRYNKIYKYVSFKTRAVPAFLSYYKKWYINGTRQVPDDIEFTSLILAIWFADDGCVIKSGKRSLTVKLSTESFGEHGAAILSRKLEDRYNIKFPIYRKIKDKDQFFIKVGTEASQYFLKEVEPYIININMRRKYNIWKDVDLHTKPKIGVLYKNYKLIFKEIINLNDFSNNELYERVKIYSRSHLRTILDKFCHKGYLNTYQVNFFPKTYRYMITDNGKSFFNKLTVDDNGIEENL